MQVSKIKEAVPDAAVTHIDCDLTDFGSVKNAAQGNSLTSLEARNPALSSESADLILVMLTLFSTPCPATLLCRAESQVRGWRRCAVQQRRRDGMYVLR